MRALVRVFSLAMLGIAPLVALATNTGTALAACSINSLSASVSGNDIQVSGDASCGGGVRAVRFKADGSVFYELGAPSANATWHGSPGNHTITIESAEQGDNNWSRPASRSTSVNIAGSQPQSQPQNQPLISVEDPYQLLVIDQDLKDWRHVAVPGLAEKWEETDSSGTYAVYGRAFEWPGRDYCTSNADSSQYTCGNLNVILSVVPTVESAARSFSSELSRPNTVLFPVPADLGPDAQGYWKVDEKRTYATYIAAVSVRRANIIVTASLSRAASPDSVRPGVVINALRLVLQRFPSVPPSYTPTNPQPAPSDSSTAARLGLTNGDLVRSDDPNNWEIDIIHAGQRRHVPNPDTLSAITGRYGRGVRAIAAADFGSIGKGADIPDVNRDANGFQQSMIDIYGEFRQPASNPTPSGNPQPEVTPTQAPQEGAGVQWARRLAAISQLYRDELGREADPEGLYAYARSSLTIDQIRDILHNSQERLSRIQPPPQPEVTPTQAPQEGAGVQWARRLAAISQLYRDELGREADPEGLYAYARSDLHIDQIRDILRNSDEGVAWRARQDASPATTAVPSENLPKAGSDSDSSTAGEALPRTGPGEEQLPRTGPAQPKDWAGGVPFVSQWNYADQDGGDNCGPASIAMVFRFYGKSMDIETAARALLGAVHWTEHTHTSFRTYGGEALSLFTNNGLGIDNLTSLDQVKAHLDQGHPVLAALMNLYYVHDGVPYPGGGFLSPHIVVVTGYDDTYVYINDPLAVKPDSTRAKSYEADEGTGKDFPVPVQSFLNAVNSHPDAWYVSAVVER